MRDLTAIAAMLLVGCVTPAPGSPTSTAGTPRATAASDAETGATDGGEAAEPTGTSPAPDVLALFARDAALDGSVHRVSLLGGALSLTVHASSAPEVRSTSDSRGTPLSIMKAVLGDGQVVQCTAYGQSAYAADVVVDELLRPSRVAPAKDAAPAPRKAAGLTVDVPEIDVTTTGGRSVLWARSLVRDAKGNVVSQHKVATAVRRGWTLKCADETPGYAKRFQAFAEEAIGTATHDPADPNQPRHVIAYRIVHGKATTGYDETATYVDAKGLARMVRHQAIITASKDQPFGSFDSDVSWTASARGEMTGYESLRVVDGAAAESVHVRRDARGYAMTTGDRKAAETRLPVKGALFAAESPAWYLKLRGVATATSANAQPARFSVFDEKSAASAGGAMPVVMKRRADGGIVYQEGSSELTLTVDAEGPLTWDLGANVRHERILSKRIP